MSDKIKELREKRGKIATEMRGIIDLAEAEKRDLTDEETAKHGELFDAQQRHADEIKVEERQIEVDREMAERASDDEAEERAARDAAGGGDGDSETRGQVAFRNWLRSGQMVGPDVAEFRALQASVDTEGGYLVAPEQFVNSLIQALDDAVFIRAAATTFTVTNAESLGAPSLDADPADADWTTELATGGEDSDMAFGKRELRPHPLAKLIKVSNKLMRQAVLNPEGLVNARLTYKFGVTQEKAFLTGSGNQQPLGLFTADANGISTGRDVSEGNTATEIKFDGLIEAKYSVKAGYWPRSQWIFHRDAVKQISKLKDGEGQYIWRESVRDGEPDRVLGAPMSISEYAPNTFTTGLYAGLFGDLSNYWIADALTMQIQRLVELYAVTNQTGFIGRLETDGQPVLEEAFARVKLG